MNKRFAAPLAAVLAMSMAFSSLAAVKLDTPVVRWSSEREALPEWTRVENASNEYQVEAFRDGERTYNSRHTFSSTDTREWLKSSGFVNKLKDSGTYTFRVMALGDGNDTLNSDWSELSAPWTFEKFFRIIRESSQSSLGWHHSLLGCSGNSGRICILFQRL